MADVFRIVAMSGSLRKSSYNKAALRYAQKTAPEGVSIGIAEIGNLPLYNDDLRPGAGFPPEVEALRAKLNGADAFLFAVTEYNYSVSAPLKNAIDWCSRPPNQPFGGKPYAMIGVATGTLGTSRGQLHLRQIMVAMDAVPISNPQVFIANGKEKFDADLNFIDKTGQDLIGQLLEKTVKLGRQLKK